MVINHGLKLTQLWTTQPRYTLNISVSHERGLKINETAFTFNKAEAEFWKISLLLLFSLILLYSHWFSGNYIIVSNNVSYKRMNKKIKLIKKMSFQYKSNSLIISIMNVSIDVFIFLWRSINFFKIFPCNLYIWNIVLASTVLFLIMWIIRESINVCNYSNRHGHTSRVALE